MFLRKFARPSMMKMMSAAAKESSTDGSVSELIKIYENTIHWGQKIPEDEGYRKALIDTTRKRLDICLEEQDPEAIVKRIGCGKFLEILLDAKFEYKILTNLLDWDPWDKNLPQLCDVIDSIDEVPKAEPPGPIPGELYERLKALAKATCERDEPQISQGISDSEEDHPDDEMFSSDNNNP